MKTFKRNDDYYIVVHRDYDLEGKFSSLLFKQCSHNVSLFSTYNYYDMNLISLKNLIEGKEKRCKEENRTLTLVILDIKIDLKFLKNISCNKVLFIDNEECKRHYLHNINDAGISTSFMLGLNTCSLSESVYKYLKEKYSFTFKNSVLLDYMTKYKNGKYSIYTNRLIKMLGKVSSLEQFLFYMKYSEIKEMVLKNDYSQHEVKENYFFDNNICFLVENNQFHEVLFNHKEDFYERRKIYFYFDGEYYNYLTYDYSKFKNQNKKLMKNTIIDYEYDDCVVFRSKKFLLKKKRGIISWLKKVLNL